MSYNTPNVLIIEEKGITTKNLISMLEGNGFYVPTTVGTGEAALKALDEINPSIILMGIRLEGELSGIETTERIHQDHEIPVVYLTADSDPETTKQARKTESFGYLTKPVTEPELTNTLQMVLERFEEFNEEKRKHEETPELSQEQHTHLIDAVPDVAYQVNPDGNIEFICDSIEELGYAPSDLIGESLDMIIAPRDREEVMRRHVQPKLRGEKTGPENAPKVIDERHCNDRNTQLLQLRLLPKTLRNSNRDVKYDELPVYETSVSWTYHKDSEDNKQFLGSAGLLRPINERLDYHQELERQVDFFNKAQDIADVGAWEYDVKNDEIYWSDQVKAIYGLSKDKTLPPEQAIQYYHPKDRSTIEKAFEKAVNNGESYDLILRLIDENDQTRWVRTRGEPQYENGEIFRVRGTIQDITDRKERERQLRKLNERLELAVEGSELGIWDWNMTTNEVEFNEQWAQMIGYSLDEIQPHLDAWKTRVHPEDMDEVQATLDAHIAGETEYYDTEHRLRTAEGDWKWIRDVGKIFERNEDGDPVRAVGIHIDINERKKRQAEIKEQRQRFESIFEQAPLGLWEEDWSGAKTYLENLEFPPSENLKKHLNNNPDLIKEIVDQIEILLPNQRVVEMLSAEDKEHLKENFRKVLTESSYHAVREELLDLWEGATSHTSENTIETFDGDQKEIRRDLQLIPGHEDDWSRVFVAYQDVTERKSLEHDLKNNQAFLRQLNEISTDRDMGFEDKIDAILRFGCEQFDCSYGFVTHIEDDTEYIEHAVGDHDLIQTGAEAPLSKTYCRKTIEQDEPLVLNDSEDVRDTVGAEPLEIFQLNSYIGAKLYVGDDSRGTVCFASSESRVDPFDENHKMMLTHIAQWIQFEMERKQRVNKLRSRTRAIEEAPIGITISDPERDDNPLIYTNKAFKSLTGYSHEEIIDRNCRFLQGEDTNPETVSEIHEAIETADTLSVELKNYRKDGTEFWNKLTIAPIRDENGTVDSWIGFQQDVTERKRKEQELQESEQRFRQLAENIDAVFWLTDPEKSEMLYINEQYEEIWGRSLEEIDENPNAFLEYIHPDDRERVESELPKQREGNYEVEYRIRRPDGSIRWIRDRAFPVEDENGEIYRIAGIAEDITERIKRKQELDEKKRLAHLGQMSSMVMHEINNPNAFIQGNIEFVQKILNKLQEPVEAGLEEAVVDILNSQLTELQGVLESIHDGTQRIESITGDVKRFAKEASSRMSDDRETTNTKTLYEKLNTLIDRYDDSGIQRSRVEIPDEQFVIPINGDDFECVLENLIDNAIDATDPTDRSIMVTMTVESDELVLSVQDNGTGITLDSEDEIFDPFVSSKTTDSGTGLGLAIIESIVEKANGTLKVDSEPGLGTNFTVRFPVIKS